MTNDITIDQLRALAQRLGLDLSETELEKILPGVNRTRLQAEELRQLVDSGVEPAGHFSAQKGQ
jgi:hypothetical protein